jgi:hypothetical protein
VLECPETYSESKQFRLEKGEDLRPLPFLCRTVIKVERSCG